MPDNELTFKANVGIKDILGRGLILQDNIAIIELIKNSKDALSKKVKIDFIGGQSQSAPKEIRISDFGKGMDIEDIKHKWLNIAYSEKKGEKRKVYAGNKGVGRFSCDRLGEKLILYTKSANGNYIKLPIDWTLFEINSKNADISTVKLNFKILNKKDFLDEIGETSFSTGTVLRINKLRSSWDEKKIKKLETELEKFVSAPDSDFTVYLSKNKDKGKKVKNNVFKELNFRTYYIKSSINASGKEINTSLHYHGEKIYEYTATNPYKNLKNITVNAHYLNFTAKSYFKRRTGYSTNEYGSVFLFLNGFRVFPYGNPKNDWLGLDQRKSQGTARYLGTREILGKVSIEDHDDIFHPVTSREGMVQNEAFLELTAYDPNGKIKLENGKMDYGFVPHILRQLERIVVQGLSWHSIIDLEQPTNTKVISEKDIKSDPTRYALKKVDDKILNDVIEKTIKTNSFKIKKFDINTALIKRLNKKSEDEYNEYILSFIKNTTGKKFEDLSPKNKGDLRKIAEDNMRALKAEKKALIKAAEEKRRANEAEQKLAEEKRRADAAEKEAKEATKKSKIAEKKALEVQKKLKDVKSENLFLRADASKDLDHIVNLHHQIVYYCSTAESEIENLKNILINKKTVSTKDVLEYVSSIESDVTKISKVSRFATNQKYKLALDSVEGNLVKFVSDYVDEINDNKLMHRRIKVVNKIDTNIIYEVEFSPMDIMILVDNFISNTKRASVNTPTKEIIFSEPVSEDGLFVVGDKGSGLHASIENPKNIFKKGFTTTDGSGRGLYHVVETLKNLGLGIRVLKDEKSFKGLTMEIFDAN